MMVRMWSLGGRWAARATSVAMAAGAAACGLIGCAGSATASGADSSTSNAPPPSPIVDIKLIAFNDLHGNLEPPKMSVMAPAGNGTTGANVAVPAGGAAYMATAIRTLKAANSNNAVVSAGDMIGASPLVSALFLDEPTIATANEFQVDFNAVGNHEFDKGQAELLRMRYGGCEKHTVLEPCRLDKPFQGARFEFLSANTQRADGSTLFPATGLKSFGSGARRVTVGFIGMTLKNTAGIVSPAGVRGLRFVDEASTANALIPQLKAQGAQIIVVLIHEGASTRGGYNDKTCPGLAGDILPILERLDPAVDVVVSGHTHRSYICDYGRVDPVKPFLLTSAGLYGTLITDIDLRFDTAAGKLVSKKASNVIVQGEPYAGVNGQVVPTVASYPSFAKDAKVDALVSRYAAAAAPLAQRPAGALARPALRSQAASGESALGNLVADSQLAATRDPANGGAQIAFMNPGGLRADLTVPTGGGPITYGQIFTVQPFGNSLVVKSMTGALLKALLEQQWSSGSNTPERPRVLFPSAGFSYSYDLKAPSGSRVSDMRLNGEPVLDGSLYRVTMNSYLASGGDDFSAFRQGTAELGGDLDTEALERYLAAGSTIAPPATDRIRRR